MTRLSSTAREQLYDAEVLKAKESGRGSLPICKLCDCPIGIGQKWDVNHQAHKPKWLGGVVDGISHHRCNTLHNNRHDTPLYHKNNAIRQRHIGAKVRTSPPMPGTFDSDIKIPMTSEFRRRPIRRSTGKEL
jgi:hypothetical protein